MSGPGVAATVKGHWPKLDGGAKVNATVDERDADMGGGAVFTTTASTSNPLAATAAT